MLLIFYCVIYLLCLQMLNSCILSLQWDLRPFSSDLARTVSRSSQIFDIFEAGRNYFSNFHHVSSTVVSIGRCWIATWLLRFFYCLFLYDGDCEFVRIFTRTETLWTLHSYFFRFQEFETWYWCKCYFCSSFRLNGHTSGLHARNQTLEIPCTA